MKDQLLSVTIKTWLSTVYDGPAKSVSSINGSGTFDILPQHSNFLTLIKNSCTVISDKGEKTTVEIKGPALLRVAGNKVTVYLGLGASDSLS